MSELMHLFLDPAVRFYQMDGAVWACKPQPRTHPWDEDEVWCALLKRQREELWVNGDNRRDAYRRRHPDPNRTIILLGCCIWLSRVSYCFSLETRQTHMQPISRLDALSRFLPVYCSNKVDSPQLAALLAVFKEVDDAAWDWPEKGAGNLQIECDGEAMEIDSLCQR